MAFGVDTVDNNMRLAGDVGVGLGLTRGGTTLRLDYGYMFSEHYRDHYGSAMARWAF